MIRIIQKPVAEGNWRRGSIPRDVRAAVLHIVEGSAVACDSWFANPESGVSAHFMVTRAGRIHQYVGIHDIAYHAGRIASPTWGGLRKGENPNGYTVGIEHEGNGTVAWTEPQLLASTALAWWLAHRFKWEPSAMTFPMHREIRATKTCPGPAFDRTDYVERVRAWRACFGSDITALVVGIR